MIYTWGFGSVLVTILQLSSSICPASYLYIYIYSNSRDSWLPGVMKRSQPVGPWIPVIKLASRLMITSNHVVSRNRTYSICKVIFLMPKNFFHLSSILCANVTNRKFAQTQRERERERLIDYLKIVMLTCLPRGCDALHLELIAWTTPNQWIV